jgi:hypothetical protein
MNYRYAEERMMRMMAGWIALTPQLPVKLEMARQVYECALHTDALGKRLGELRSSAQVSRPPNEAFVGLINEIEDKEEWEDTIERLVGIHRVLKPQLITHYSAHLAAANPIYEPPTLRILAHLVDDEKRHVERGLVVLGDLLDSAEAHRRASQWGGGGRSHGLRRGRKHRGEENRAELKNGRKETLNPQLGLKLPVG